MRTDNDVDGTVFQAFEHLFRLLRSTGTRQVFYLDGKVSAVFGTHTHIPTADETILPKGTGYITDVGMTGVEDSVLGVKKENAIEKFRTHMPVRFDCAEGECKMDCVVFDIDTKTGLAVGAERFTVRRNR